MTPHQMAYNNFVNTCKSPATRKIYAFSLSNFMDYLKIPCDESNKLLDKDPKMIQIDIINYITYLKEKSRSYAVISLYVAALSKFYTMNDILSLNWKKIKSFIGEHEKTVEDRPYTHSEIHTLVHDASPRNKALILLLSSSGVRIGSIPLLRIRDLKPIDEFNIYRINVYSKSKKSNYFTFCTPECRNEIDVYIDYRKRSGEDITEDSPLFRAEFNNMDYSKITKVVPLSVYSVENIMKRLLIRTGMRKQGAKDNKRNDIMQCHGLRKFFETNAFKAGMQNIYIRRLMGQKSGLEDSYLKLSESELLEGDNKHEGYLGIIDQLTINNENRLKRENVILKSEVSQIQEALADLKNVKKVLGLE